MKLKYLPSTAASGDIRIQSVNRCTLRPGTKPVSKAALPTNRKQRYKKSAPKPVAITLLPAADVVGSTKRGAADPVDCTQPDWRENLSVGDHVDAKDSYHSWYEGVIMEMLDGGSNCK